MINSNDIQNEWRIPIEYRNNSSVLLRDQYVEDGTELLWVCGDDEVIEIECQNGRFNVPMPLPPCNTRPRPEMSKAKDYGICPYDLYQVGFNLRCRGSNFFFETYKICFDQRQMRTIFAINQAYPYGR